MGCLALGVPRLAGSCGELDGHISTSQPLRDVALSFREGGVVCEALIQQSSQPLALIVGQTPVHFVPAIGLSCWVQRHPVNPGCSLLLADMEAIVPQSRVQHTSPAVDEQHVRRVVGSLGRLDQAPCVDEIPTQQRHHPGQAEPCLVRRTVLNDLTRAHVLDRQAAPTTRVRLMDRRLWWLRGVNRRTSGCDGRHEAATDDEAPVHRDRRGAARPTSLTLSRERRCGARRLLFVLGRSLPLIHKQATTWALRPRPRTSHRWTCHRSSTCRRASGRTCRLPPSTRYRAQSRHSELEACCRSSST